jgi:hypothetical protein
MRRLITADSHLVPPVWLVDELPEKWRQYFPRLETIDGVRHVVYPSLPGSGSQMMITSGGRGSVVPVETEEGLARINHSNVCDGAQPAFDPDQRLEEMAPEGVVGAVLIDNATVNYTYVEPEAELAWCRIVNDWMADTISHHAAATKGASRLSVVGTSGTLVQPFVAIRVTTPRTGSFR